MDVLAELNYVQKQAVETISGPVLILAGPGSGKTRVITHRIAYLIKVCQINPRHIMAVTFTNKAAREMEARLCHLARSGRKELTIGTFHSICVRILRQDGKQVGVDPGFVIYDDDDHINLIKRATKASGFDPKQYAPRAISSSIGAAKSQMMTPEEYLQQGNRYFDEVVGRIYQQYQKLLNENNALDFDDLLMKTVQLFRTSPEVLSRYQNRYRYIQVDEFQDTNLVQYELVRQMGDKHRNICVVGDPDQSIYSWRSADLRNILNFEKDYPEARVILLEQNYRSTKNILDTASYLISANQQRKAKDLWTENGAGELTTLVETYNEQEEAQFIVNEIECLVKNGAAKPGDCAVMYRTNAQSRVLEETFVRFGTPYRLVAGTRFYDRREVKDIIAYLKLIYNPDDSLSLLRIINTPGRGIGQQTLARLSSQSNAMGISQYGVLRRVSESRDEQPPFTPHIARSLTGFTNMMEELIALSQDTNLTELFDRVIERSGYREYLMAQPGGEERWENVMELRTVAQQYSDLEPKEALSMFLEEIALVNDTDGLEESPSAVTLITIHQAKGLEFPVVFIVGMEDGILPHFKSLDDPTQLEEERRLCYVGITRAQKRIYLVRAFRRSLMGRSEVNSPSRFLDDIPGHLVSGAGTWPGVNSAITPATASSPAPTGKLKAGDHVSHPVFGNGVVVGCQALDGDIEVTVAFNGAGIKKLLSSFARLEKVE